MTTKQQKAINIAVENGGNVSKAMRDAGYSVSTAKNPNKLTDSKAWKESLNEYLPDSFLLESLTLDIVNNPGNRKAYLELAFKLKGKLNTQLINFIDTEPTIFNVTRGYAVQPENQANQDE
ncbi:MAG TPA: hypothetical protein VLF90_04375 [Patescibacteria group bacterium]|nr:hypothetical protein [Patescibacteria group bacterium]